MLYKFRSKAAADVIMTGPVGDRLMRLLGREPAPQGIVLSDQIPAAIAALEAAIQAAEDARRRLEEEARAEGRPPPPREEVGLRQRAWPLIEQMRRSHAAGNDIVWGA